MILSNTLTALFFSKNFDCNLPLQKYMRKNLKKSAK